MEAIVQQENYGIVAITEAGGNMETCYSYYWTVAMHGYKVFRRDRQGRRGSAP